MSKRLVEFVLTLVSVGLLACSPASDTVPTPAPTVDVAATVTAQVQATLAAATPAPTATLIPTLSPTATFDPTVVPTPTVALTATPIPTPTSTPFPTATPTPIPTPTRTPMPLPAWIDAANNYAYLAEEVVRDSLANREFALTALNETSTLTFVRLEKAKDRYALLISQQSGYESELHTARRDIRAPDAVEESALALSIAITSVLLDISNSVDIELGWEEVLHSMGTEVSSDLEKPPYLLKSINAFEDALSDFRATVERVKPKA